MRSDKDILLDVAEMLDQDGEENFSWNKLIIEVLLDIRLILSMKYIGEPRGFLDKSNIKQVLDRYYD